MMQQQTNYATVWDVIECKGRLAHSGSFKERLAFWLARMVTSAVMRDPALRRELTLSIAFDLKKAGKWFDEPMPEPPPAKND